MTQAPSPSPAPSPVPEGVGIVHLGVGAFFKAFIALQVEDAIAASGGDWAILGVSLRRPDQRDALQPRGFRYHAVELAPDGKRTREIGALRGVIVAPEDPASVLAALCDPRVRLVTLTITEKGYGHSPATGRLDRSHPDIAHDLTKPDAPRSAVGLVVAALAARLEKGLRPFTALSCDNLPANGALLRGLVLEFARERDPALAEWIGREARFPSSMVDRIVPAVTPGDLDVVEALIGERDGGAVLHEPFRQWVIEDDFVDGDRPDLAAAGAQMVDDVAPFELMKLRCLNGTHSALAYLGYLAGHETITEAVADPALAGFIEAMWREEIVPSLDAPPGTDLSAYCSALMERYRNPDIRHRTWQIAMDGSQKLPQRLLGTVRDNLATDRPIHRLALAVAAWMRYVGGTDERGEPIDVRDPFAERLRALSDEAADDTERVAALLGFEEVFEPALARDERFRDAVTTTYGDLVAKGARGAAMAAT